MKLKSTKTIIGFGMLGTFGAIFLGFWYMLIPDWRIHAAIWGTISLLPVGIYLVFSGNAKSLPTSGQHDKLDKKGETES